MALTDEEKEYIIENKESMFPHQIAKKLDRHHQTITNFLRKLED